MDHTIQAQHKRLVSLLCDACPWRVHQRPNQAPKSGSKARTARKAATALVCRAAAAAKAPKIHPAGGDAKNQDHKLFDEAFISVRSGNGGRGEIAESGKGKMVKNYKYKPGGNMSKQIWLPNGEPACGANGADCVLVADEGVDTLLHLHKRKQYVAPNGANGNPAMGSAGPKTRHRDRPSTLPVVIPVPLGTVVKRKGTGRPLGELMHPGQRLLVARGGQGGLGVTSPAPIHRQHSAKRAESLEAAGAEDIPVEDTNWKVDAQGGAGEELGLQLLLRVVADVGIVGLPNAGKSSLLAAMTRAAPQVASYPFTTLMPNLGVMGAGEATLDDAAPPVLVDLPGLIEGASQGRGLGRMFLRHLRRTQAILHVVDGAAEDPAWDYWCIRSELQLYNPEYCQRPHLVALNKMDLEDAHVLRDEIHASILTAAQRMQEAGAGESGAAPAAPVAILDVSAQSGEGIEQLAGAVRDLIGFVPASSMLDDDSSFPSQLQW
ncbi:hypothetical protein WJX84_008093 [Apatococcus fuscideae]|uniref:Uncharacterized protein n=1 Tax=Apatococcus fuscideae TaxID=2026836 RepID=A0AAW1RRX2_9CHLO